MLQKSWSLRRSGGVQWSGEASVSELLRTCNRRSPTKRYFSPNKLSLYLSTPRWRSSVSPNRIKKTNASASRSLGDGIYALIHHGSARRERFRWKESTARSLTETEMPGNAAAFDGLVTGLEE
jgi:hypothetical protein